VSEDYYHNTTPYSPCTNGAELQPSLSIVRTIRRKECKQPFCYLHSLPTNPHMVMQIPEGISLQAIRNCGAYIRYIPQDKLTEDIYLEAIKYCKYSIELIPTEKLTYNICFESIKQNIESIHHIPSNLLTNDIINIIINHPNREKYRKYLPEEYQILI
jgi:hypothetical protein